MANLNAVRSAEIEIHLLEDDGSIPNNSKLPLMIYRSALRFGEHDPAGVCEGVFAAHGWGDAWRNGIYDFPHYHSTAHEVLGIARGRARVRLGGERGIVVTVEAGDVIVIPAGVGHQNRGSSPDLLVVGAYPRGQSFDLCRGEPGERPRVLE
ncbi:MAG: cupin domain-containing protein, partial [Geminicoccales bacterium]